VTCDQGGRKQQQEEKAEIMTDEHGASKFHLEEQRVLPVGRIQICERIRSEKTTLKNLFCLSVSRGLTVICPQHAGPSAGGMLHCNVRRSRDRLLNNRSGSAYLHLGSEIEKLQTIVGFFWHPGDS
jgi:hypothetical protein